MKRFVFIFSTFWVLFSCQNTKQNTDFNNGIDKRILQIVDSLPLPPDVYFVTVDFTVDTLLNPIIIIVNGGVLPAPPMPPEPLRKVLLTEVEWFKGYKKYNDRYIIFTKCNYFTYYPHDDKFDKFVIVDSLQFDEEAFEKYDYYEWDNVLGRRYELIKKVYRIEKNDRLVLLDRDIFHY